MKDLCTRRFWSWACAAILICGQALPANAEQLRLTLDQARAGAVRALQSGQPADALTLADGVLLGAPDDALAGFVRARALAALGRDDEALEAAQTVWAKADASEERFFAAMLMGQMTSATGQNIRSQLWLRRAAEIAPQEQMREEAIRGFRAVRKRTPWRFALDLSVSPSDNLNNAPTEAQEVLTGYVTVTPPLSGVRYSADLKVQRSTLLAPRQRLNFSGFAMNSRVELSSEAKQIAGADANDYKQLVLGAAVGWDSMNETGDRLLRTQLSARRHWRADEPLADALRLDVSVQQALGDLRLTARLGAEDLKRHDSSIGNYQRRDAGLALARGFDFGSAQLSLALGETLSQAAPVGRTDGVVALRYSHGRTVAGMLPSLELSYAVFNYDAPWVGTPNGPARRDRSRSAELSVLLPAFDYYGFAPELGVSFTDRSSNYNLYESRSTDLRLGLKSIF